MDAGAWQAPERAHTPWPRHGYGDHAVEVSKARQLLMLIRGRVQLVTHVSTGATGNTPVGVWHVYRKVVGWDWVLWYPSYFPRGFAIHGYPRCPRTRHLTAAFASRCGLRRALGAAALRARRSGSIPRAR